MEPYRKKTSFSSFNSHDTSDLGDASSRRPSDLDFLTDSDSSGSDVELEALEAYPGTVKRRLSIKRPSLPHLLDLAAINQAFENDEEGIHFERNEKVRFNLGDGVSSPQLDKKKASISSDIQQSVSSVSTKHSDGNGYVPNLDNVTPGDFVGLKSADVFNRPDSEYLTYETVNLDKKRGNVLTKRLIFKNGQSNTSNTNVDKKRSRYLSDIFTTVLELRWRWTFLIFILSFILSWTLFALIWWLICTSNEEECVEGVHNFKTALLFSIETQHTIGYGTRAASEDCVVTIFLVMLQSLVGVLIQCTVTGIIFAKLGRAKQRGQTVIFSKFAVIHKHEKHLCLMFRIGDLRKSHMICVTVNAALVKRKKNIWSRNQSPDDSDEHAEFKRYKIDLTAESQDLYFMAWPIKVTHEITESSPLWDINPEILQSNDFEIIVVLEGVNETTGMTTQLRTSYLANEIKWGHKLAPLFTYQKLNGQYNIDYARFHDIVAVDTHELSAKEHFELKGLVRRRSSAKSNQSNSSHHQRTNFHPQISTVMEIDEDEEYNDSFEENDRDSIPISERL